MTGYSCGNLCSFIFNTTGTLLIDLMNFDFRILSSYCCLYSKKSLISYFMNVYTTYAH